MRWWAVSAYSFLLRLFGVVSAFFAMLTFVISLFAIREIEAAFARNNIVFAEGVIGVVAFNLCGLGFALFAALGVYAMGQLLLLLVSMEHHLRGLRMDIRGRAQREPELPGPPDPSINWRGGGASTDAQRRK